MTHQIKYTGPTQHTRIITKKDAEGAGFILEDNLSWSLSNRHSVIADLDETAVEYFQSDPDFRLKEISSEDEAATPKAAPEATTADEIDGAAAGSGSTVGGTTGARGRRTTSTTTAP